MIMLHDLRVTLCVCSKGSALFYIILMAVIWSLLFKQDPVPKMPVYENYRTFTEVYRCLDKASMDTMKPQWRLNNATILCLTTTEEQINRNDFIKKQVIQVYGYL